MPNIVQGYPRKFVYTSGPKNSNKFWQTTLFDNGDVEDRWGRVGEPGQSKVYPMAGLSHVESKVREKLGKGYVEFHDASNGGVPIGPLVQGARLETVATTQIEHDPLLSSLIARLARANKHNILGNTTLTFSDRTGMYSTPLGVVTPANVSRARGILSQIGDALGGIGGLQSWELMRLVEQYMMLVPIDIGRRRLTIEEVFPGLAAVRRQNDILDSLDASLQMLTTAPADQPRDEQRVFDVSLTKAGSDVATEIERMFTRTKRSAHESSHLSVKSVLFVDIRANRAAFERDGERIGNVKRLWHGTRVSNVLSILRGGLVIPPANSAHCTGRMYGNGVYASDISTKALNYAYGYWDGGKRDSNCFMFLVDMAMGREYVPGGGPYPKMGFDSTFAKGGSSGVYNNEMIVYRPSQVRLDMLVEFE